MIAIYLGVAASSAAVGASCLVYVLFRRGDLSVAVARSASKPILFGTMGALAIVVVSFVASGATADLDHPLQLWGQVIASAALAAAVVPAYVIKHCWLREIDAR